ncbi:tyrosine-protein phosphatase [Microbacterium rhizomatis]|uniref:Tyrosine-protein phosphatase n=1 Tax=Microbacterium rhizomatis TaxID=1631477 RepID=A0A5J5IXW7_9MICO|nr:tyrosine-protein phosphatase [Microbacterium rhizomatis]KAA9105856.1 tyrosine-protein phosphatase [Microbacterium rhizomatis]
MTSKGAEVRITASFLQGTFNSRGLGGFGTVDGGVLASGVLYRSDALSGLTGQGLQALADHRIGTVIDLRTEAERARAADRLPCDGSVRLVPLPVQGGAMDELVQKLLPAGEHAALSEEEIAGIVEQVPTLEELYVAILGSSATEFADIARTVVAASGSERPGVLLHCTAGKDRTGLAAAILLLVANVPRNVIVEDYVRTGRNLAGTIAEALISLITTLGVPLTPRLRALATESPASAIEAAMDWITSEHGDAAGYLRTGGMTTAEIKKLTQTLRAT